MWFRKLRYFREHNFTNTLSKLYNFESYPKVEVLFFLIQERKDWVHDPEVVRKHKIAISKLGLGGDSETSAKFVFKES